MPPLALSHVEHATCATCSSSHASHDEDPEEDKGNEGEHIDEELHQTVAFFVLITVVARKLLLFACIIDERFQFLYRSKLHLNAGVITSLFLSLFKHISDVFGLDIHKERLLVVIHNNLLCIAFEHHLFEVVIGGGCLHARLHPSLREEEESQDAHYYKIEPGKIEPGHIGLGLVLLFVDVHF